MTSTAAVFACIFIASPQGAQKLSTTVSNTSALATQYAQLTNVYPSLINQDFANRQTPLYAAIATAVTTVTNLIATLASIVASGDSGFILRGMQVVASNALTALKNAQADEINGGE